MSNDSLALRHHFATVEQQKATSTLGMWVFIAQEILFFGGLFGAYAVYRNLHFDVFATGSHHLDLKLGLFNTIVLIASSLTMAMAVHSAALGQRRRIVGYILATIFLGGVFLGVKVIEYKDKFDHHLVPGHHFSGHTLGLGGAQEKAAEIFYSLYFAMTGLHALHMIIGIPILATIAVFAWRGRYSVEYNTPVELVGLYWHFVDIIWIFLFPLLYLIGNRTF